MSDEEHEITKAIVIVLVILVFFCVFGVLLSYAACDLFFGK